MPRNGSGTMSLTATSAAPAVSSTLIESSDFNTTMQDIVDALTQSVSKDGQTVITGDIDFDGNQLILDADGDSTLTADTDDQADLRLGGTDIFRFKTVASAVNGLDFIGSATGNAVDITAFGTDTDVGIEINPKGAGPLDLTSGALNLNKGSDIASATTTDIGAATGNFVDITGNTTITGFGTVKAGTKRTARFTGAPLLTYNATSLITPMAADYQVVAGDVLELTSLGSGNWIITNIMERHGTWTPDIWDTSLSNEGVTYTTQYGSYTKIGNRVFIQGFLEWSALGTLTTSEQARIGTLPFTSNSTTGANGGVSFTEGSGLAITALASISGSISPNTNYFALYTWDSTLGGLGLLISELSSAGSIEFNGQYIV